MPPSHIFFCFYPYTKALISAIPEIDPRRRKERILLEVIYRRQVTRHLVAHFIRDVR